VRAVDIIIQKRKVTVGNILGLNPEELCSRREAKIILDVLYGKIGDNWIDGIEWEILPKMEDFGWPANEGIKIVRAILAALHIKFLIIYAPAVGRKRSRTKVVVKKNTGRDQGGFVVVTPVKTEQVVVGEPEIASLLPVNVASNGGNKKIWPGSRKSRLTREERYYKDDAFKERVNQYGQANADWAYGILCDFIKVLRKEFPNITSIISHKTGKWDPVNGRRDTLDKRGEDFSYLVTFLSANGRIIIGRIIYDNKSSEVAAEKANRFFSKLENPPGCLLRRAVWCNQAYHTKEDVVGNFLKDAINIGMIPSDIDKEIILGQFRLQTPD